MFGRRPFRRLRQPASGGSPAESQGSDSETVRLKALQDQLAAWAYDTDQHRAMQRAVLAKMHGLPAQQASAYGTPFPGSSTTTNTTTTNAGVSVAGITGILAAMLGSVLVGALLAQTSNVVGNSGTGQSAASRPAPQSPPAPAASDDWQLIVVPAAGEPHEP
jgi:hypothetical protein